MQTQQATIQATEPNTKTKWLPALIGLLLGFLIAILWWTLEKQEFVKLHKGVQIEAENLSANIEADMRSRIPALQRIVNRWEIRGGTPKKEFINDAQNYFFDLPGFQALAWVDESLHIRWVVPVAGNEKALGLNLSFEEKYGLALQKANKRRIPTMTSPLELVQGGKGFLVYFPIFVDGEFKGFVLAVFKIKNWLEYVFSIKKSPEEQVNFKLYIFIDDFPVYQQQGWDDAREIDLEAISIIKIMDHHFTIHCRPTQHFILHNSTILNEIITIAGLLLSVLVSIIIYFYQKATAEVWRTHAAKNALEISIQQHKATKEELQNTHSRLTLATKAGNIGVWIWEITTNKLTWNDIMFQLYDVPPDVNLTYETWQNAVHTDDLKEAEALLEKALQGKASFDTEFRISLTGDIVRNIRAAAIIQRDHLGNPLQMIGVNWDITERKQAEELLATERRRLSDIIKGTNVGTWEWNVQSGETIFNERWANIIGFNIGEISPVSIDTWIKFAHPDDLKKSNDLLKRVFKKELDYYECEVRMRHKNGDWIWVLDKGKVATWTEDGKPLLMSGTHQDITERKKIEEIIEHLATHDDLTDLPTLKLAKDRALMAISTADRNKVFAAIMFIDLDGLKKVNDNFGHDAGDALLKEMAQRFASCVRKTDTVARIGGDEFLIILTELKSPKNAEQIAKMIIKKASKSFSINKIMVKVSASIGIAIYPINGENVETLIKKADDAMYIIKRNKKSGYQFVNS